MAILAYAIVVFLCTGQVLSADLIDKNLEIQNADRSIDITSQIVRITSKIVFVNKGEAPINYVLYTVEPQNKNRVRFVSATSSDFKNPEKVVATKIQGQEDKGVWRINLREKLQQGKKLTLEVEVSLTQILTPYPPTITQKEKQLLIYKGNAFLYSPYAVQKQTSTIITGTKNVESFTKIKPATQSDVNIVYGPYENAAQFEEKPLDIHYENNTPFLTITELIRVLEISHWGNIAVEETISLEHKGAALKGSFSRYEFQRDSQSGLTSVKSFKTILPSSAKDVYYRDAIGNISTSHLRPLSDFTELDVRPRFPLLGGWKTKYTVGYNIPSYEHLYNSGENFLLKMRVMDHIYDDMVVEQLTTKIILPEGAKSIELHPPFPVTRLPDYKHYTYLDTMGRTVVTMQSKNLLENHIQDFELKYKYSKLLMLQEPILVIIGCFAIFVIGIATARFDMSISKPIGFKRNN